MKTELWPMDQIIPYAKNPRKISEKAIDKVALSIKEFGWRQPIVVVRIRMSALFARTPSRGTKRTPYGAFWCERRRAANPLSSDPGKFEVRSGRASAAAQHSQRLPLLLLERTDG
jgi:hypothetical protein